MEQSHLYELEAERCHAEAECHVDAVAAAKE
jgi:hypothetical protein